MKGKIFTLLISLLLFWCNLSLRAQTHNFNTEQAYREQLAKSVQMVKLTRETPSTAIYAIDFSLRNYEDEQLNKMLELWTRRYTNEYPFVGITREKDTKTILLEVDNDKIRSAEDVVCTFLWENYIY